MEFIDKEIYKDKYGIYGIKNVINNKIYVGQTRNSFKKRYWHHNWKLNNNSHDNIHLQKAWNKYGENCFVFFVIELISNNDIDYVDEKEKYYIDYYKKLNLSYNMLLGGGGHNGLPMSKEAKQIIGLKNHYHGLGRKASEKTKQKMSQTRKNNTYFLNKKDLRLSEDLARQIKELLINGKTMMQVSKEMNIDYKLINNIVSNNAWNHVNVIGWDEFQKNRKKSYRLTRNDAEAIRELYKNGKTIKEICNIYHKERHTISLIIHYKTFK